MSLSLSVPTTNSIPTTLISSTESWTSLLSTTINVSTGYLSNMYNSTNFITSEKGESSWLILRLIDSFSLAVLQQSKESTLNGNINDTTNTFLSYWMSPFSMMCMITAVILNRIIIFASARRNRRLPYISNLLLRSFAIYILCLGSYGLLVSIKCYSNNPILQYLLNKVKYFDFNKEVFLNKKFLSIPFGTTLFEEVQTNITNNNVTTSSFINDNNTNAILKIGPTTSILKCFHLSLCISQILDTFISVASGSKPSLETGITLFEYSLAFQEAQVISKPSNELLIIALIALLNQLNIHILGLFDLKKYKLITTSIIGLFTLSFYSYNLFSKNILNIPFIIILGYFPHFCILVIIILSEFIFLLSGIFRLSFNDLTMMSLFENWNSINVSLSDDFYTALINFGEFIINVSISQCYIQETSNINLPFDNYINLELSEFKKKKINGYGNEYKDNPELVELNSINHNTNNSSNSIVNSNTIFNRDNNFNNEKANKKRKSWIFITRFKCFNKVLFKFLKLVKLKIMSFFINNKYSNNNNLSPEEIDNLILENNSIKKYRIIPDENGGFIYKNEVLRTVNIDNVKNDEIESNYSKLLLDTNILENDTSPDYVEYSLDDEEEEEEEEDDDDDDYYDDNDTHNHNKANEKELIHYNNEYNINKSNIDINELITLQDLRKILMPSNENEFKMNQILSYHLQNINDNVSHLTRSHFNKYYVDDLKLLDLLKEKNKNKSLNLNKINNETEKFNHMDHGDLGTCVICHENSRQIILWPCRCLAICENCRISLFVREFATCVCCRHNVEGYSKVYIP